jgi:hypothetical protein
MGVLAKYIQDEFVRHCPGGWQCQTEVSVLGDDFAKQLGYRPQADVVLSSDDGAYRLWIEFEISRADPVANHTKFATAHLFQPQRESDSFVSMMSPHIAAGKRILGSSAILLMRHIGMRAFQTVLLPQIPPDTIKSLNRRGNRDFTPGGIDIPSEIDRALEVAKPRGDSNGHRIHFAAEMRDVMCNLANWNHETESAEGAERWGCRTIKYFVHDRRNNTFAPSKFCAYVDTKLVANGDRSPGLLPMTLDLYISLGESDKRFDGTIARTHLEKRLAMRCLSAADAPAIATHFAYWLERRRHLIKVNRDQPFFLTPTEWYCS